MVFWAPRIALGIAALLGIGYASDKLEGAAKWTAIAGGVYVGGKVLKVG